MPSGVFTKLGLLFLQISVESVLARDLDFLAKGLGSLLSRVTF